MNPLNILIVDDERSLLKSLDSYLSRRGHRVLTSENGPQALKVIATNAIDLVLTDYRMPEMNGLELLEQVKAINPVIDVVVMTAYGSVEDAVDIMKAGAYDYLSKPVDLDLLEGLIRRINEKTVLARENSALKEQLKQRFHFETIISNSPEMEAVLNTAGRVAASNATVLVRGESGTGKELIARAIHHASPRADKPFVVVNVAALSENLLESELFGHEKGAFTGAIQHRIGRFEEADGGTLFIDEVGEIPLTVQVKLLRAIQFGQIERLGGNKAITVDVRIIAATHRNLEEMIKNSVFRDDLYYRLNVVSITIPPLRRRKSELPLLVDHFIKSHAQKNNKKIAGITRDALDRLMKHDFPGNVRELENIIERAVVLMREDRIGLEDLPPMLDNSITPVILDPENLQDAYPEKVRAFETAVISEALKRSHGNKSAAARMIGITERHLRSRLEKLGMKESLPVDYH